MFEHQLSISNDQVCYEQFIKKICYKNFNKKIKFLKLDLSRIYCYRFRTGGNIENLTK